MTQEDCVDFRNFYLIMSVVGTIIPWILFGSFFMEHGFDIPFFLQSLFASGAAGGFTADVFVSIIVFWAWSWRDASRRQVERWWLIFPATCFVGLSLALPLYLYLRERDQTRIA